MNPQPLPASPHRFKNRCYPLLPIEVEIMQLSIQLGIDQSTPEILEWINQMKARIKMDRDEKKREKQMLKRRSK
jgi:hypothetical protein